jgi:hypothetical protein
MRTFFKTSIWAFGFLSFAVAGCGKAPSGFALRQADPPASECTIDSTAQSLRIFVMVDNSGSTEQTDPSQYFRVQTLRTFLGTYGSHANLAYGFGYFADDAYLYDVNLGRYVRASVANPFGTSAEVSGALDTYHASIPPRGNTGYSAAFSAIESAITRDESAGRTGDYAVVFMSDGQPTDIDGDVPAGLSALVSSLKAATGANGKSHLSVSTVYFGSAGDTTSIGNLRTMATQGGGQFVDTNHLAGGGLSIDDVVTIPGC